MRSRSLLTVAAVGVCSLNPASAAVITTADGAFGADNQIQGPGFGNRELVNKGNSLTLELRANGNPANNFVGVLRFDLSSLDADIETAKLTLNLASDYNDTTTLAVYALTETSAGGGTDASGIAELSETAYAEGPSNFSVLNPPNNNLVGDNAPGFDETATGPNMVTASSTLLASIPIASGTAAGTDLVVSNAALASFLNADTNNAVVFYLFNTNSSETILLTTGDGSNPAADRPTLEITLVPEPGSFVLCGVGSLLLVLRRRR
ncbi:MAG: hypothetical protein AAF750_00150 [Planctomycetota bacterium]